MTKEERKKQLIEDVMPLVMLIVTFLILVVDPIKDFLGKSTNS